MSFWLSFPRFLLSLFPLFIMLGRILNKPFYLTMWAAVSLIFYFIFGSIALQHGPTL